jgi:hypothetical protein
MITNSATTIVFLQTVQAALAQLKRELQRDYERAYPALREIIHLVLDEEETKAWKLSQFPHLIFPDLVEAHIEKLNLQRPETSHEAVVPHRFAPMAQAAAMSRSVLSTIRQQVGLGEETPSPNLFGQQFEPTAQH